MTATADIQAPAAHLRAILVLGLPLIGSHLAQFAIHLTDTLMLGWYDVEALAASVLAVSLFLVLFLVGSGFAWAVMPLVASAAAQGDTAQMRRAARMGMWLSILYGMAAMVPILSAGPLLRLAGQDPALAGLADDYLAIAGWGIVPALLVMVLKSHLSALEATRMVLWSTVFAAVANGLLNYALIFGNWGAPELGLRGAAIASLVSHLGPLALLAVYAALAPVTRAQALFSRFWRADWPAFVLVFRLGWPIGLTTLAEIGLFSVAALMMGWIGTAELAAHGIAMEISTGIFMIHVGLSQVATVRAGRATGRRDAGELRIGARVVLGCALGVAAVTVVLFLALPGPLMRLFLDPGDPALPQIVATGTALLAVAALFQIADSTQIITLGLLRGVRDTRVPMMLAVFSYWMVGVPAAWVMGFGLGWGAPGVWGGMVVGLTLAAAGMSLRFWRRLPVIARDWP